MSIYNYHRYCREQAMKEKHSAREDHKSTAQAKILSKKHNMVEGYNDRLNDFISRMVEQPIYMNNDRLVNEKID